MPRTQNAHAYVNAGFRFDLDPSTLTVNSYPSIVLGGLSQSFTHASKTEAFLVGKSLNDPNTITSAFQLLDSELIIDSDPVLSSPEYRRSLALSLFYKYLLCVNNSNIGPRYKSAADSIIDSRPLSSGKQDFPTDPSEYPVSQPIPKLNAFQQASGEAQYVYDKTFSQNELHGAFIQSSLANCRIDSIDTSAALSIPGVVRIIFAKDIPGVNSFVPAPLQPELLFADDFVDYAGQSIGLVVAQSVEVALAGARAVQIKYKDAQKPILDVYGAIEAGSFFPKPANDFVYGDAEGAIAKAACVVEEEILLDTQYHFYMENQVAEAEPTDDGLDVNCGTQWLDLVQNGVAQVLGVSGNKINVKIKQLGGAYGGKITR
jgi:hypothetical protein